MRHLSTSTSVLAFALLTLPTAAFAAPPGGDADAGGSASVSLGGDGADTSADGDAGADAAKQAGKRKDVKWIKRWAPEPMMGELGIYGGVFFPASNVELFEPDLDLVDQGHKEFGSVAPDIGARLGFYPSRFFGIEAEGGVMPSNAGGQSATLYTIRGHLVAQLGLWSVTPFVLVGAGGLGVSSDRAAVGNDLDPLIHFGGGLKFFLTRYAALRLDVRDNVSHACDNCGGNEQFTGPDATYRSHNPEVLLGLALTLGRKKDEPAPQPTVRKDTDGDGLYDDEDQCVNDPETVNDFQDEDGCPESDKDGDGFWDVPDQDKCPDEPGVAPDGCPIPDTDGDGFLDPDDKCVEEPETQNGFEDGDGCPDEVPDEVQKFMGVLEGIYFDTDKDTIKPASEKKLQKALDVLSKYPDIRVKISGHTDSRGDKDHNMDLSRRRAASVKTWLTEHGIDGARMETDGFGPEKPIDTNDTKAGRSKNRRIEFEILSK